MHTCASNSELFEPPPEPEHTLNRRLRRRNRRVPFEQRNEPPAQPKVVYAPILDINYFRHFLDMLENYNQMDDEPMCPTDRVVALIPGSVITIPETANKFAIKDEGSSNSETDKIIARMDAMTMKMDSWYKELQSRSKQPNPDHNDDDTPMSCEEEAKFMQTLHPKFDKFADKQSGRPSGSLLSNTQPNLKGSSSKPYQPLQAQNEQVNIVFTRSGKSYDPPINPNDQPNDSETPIIFENDDEDEEPTPQPKPKDLKLVKENLTLKPYKPKILSALIPNKVPPKLGDPGSFLIPCNFNKAFSCDALADLAKNMLVKVGKFTFPINFVILEIEEDGKVHIILVRPFLHTAEAVIRVKQKQLNLGVGIERMTFHIDSAMKHSFSNDDTCFNIDVIDEILEEYFDALLEEGSKMLYSIKGTILEEQLFAEFDEFMAMTTEENSESDSDTEEPPFEKITFNTDYKIKTSLKEPPMDLELKPLPDNLEYAFLEEPYFLPVIISSQLSKENKNKVVSILKGHKQAFAWKTTDILRIYPSFFVKEIVKLLDTGIIDPIADSPWVSPIHCVPKKGGITVVTNKKDELVPTRTVTIGEPHKGVKASANSDVMYSFTSAQDGNPLQDDVRLCLGDDLKKAQDHRTDLLIPSGIDLFIPSGTDLLIPSGTDLLIPSGTNLLIPSGTDLLIRSGTDLLNFQNYTVYLFDL
ncbi:hypothetical protein Tco_0564862 [Tanacetum coccineum]